MFKNSQAKIKSICSTACCSAFTGGPARLETVNQTTGICLHKGCAPSRPPIHLRWRLAKARICLFAVVFKTASAHRKRVYKTFQKKTEMSAFSGVLQAKLRWNLRNFQSPWPLRHYPVCMRQVERKKNISTRIKPSSILIYFGSTCPHGALRHLLVRCCRAEVTRAARRLRRRVSGGHYKPRQGAEQWRLSRRAKKWQTLLFLLPQQAGPLPGPPKDELFPPVSSCHPCRKLQGHQSDPQPRASAMPRGACTLGPPCKLLWVSLAQRPAELVGTSWSHDAE